MMNYSRFLNPLSLARKPSPIRVMTEILSMSPPSMISLAAGQPNPDMFPFEEAEFKLRGGGNLKITGANMTAALQYGPSIGHAALLQFLHDLQKRVHNPPLWDADPDKGKTEISVHTGSQDGLCKVFEMLIQKGDHVIIDSPTYSGTLSILNPHKCKLLHVETDNLGMNPEKLLSIFQQWKPSDAKDVNSDIPKIIYTIPNGSNPTGACISLERRKQIYEIAQKHDALIIEDDPYFYLQFSDHVPSFLSMDTDGRVLRMDSFSKIVSAGMRVGMLTGPKSLVDQVVLHTQASTMHTSSLSQVLLTYLFKEWGIDGFLEHTKKVQDFYRSQKDHMNNSAEKWLTGLAEWHPPSAGMFFWMKLLGVHDTYKLISQRAIAKEVLLVPGNAFLEDPTKPSPYVRASFSLASPERMDKGLERLSLLIKEEIQRNSSH